MIRVNLTYVFFSVIARLTKSAEAISKTGSQQAVQSIKTGLLRPHFVRARNDGRGILIFVFLTLFSTTNCHAAIWSSTELIEKAKALDGRKLGFRGELVTTILNRGEYSWVNLNDGSNAIGVWCKSSLLSPVKFAGSYKNRGDIVEVTGTFNRACSVHNGELDLHADTIKILKTGRPIIRTIDLKRIYSAIIIFTLTILTVIIFKKIL